VIHVYGSDLVRKNPKESGLFGAVAAFATFSIPFQPSDGRRNSSMMALLVRVDASVVFLYHN
jgi:hypothetical protein